MAVRFHLTSRGIIIINQHIIRMELFFISIKFTNLLGLLYLLLNIETYQLTNTFISSYIDDYVLLAILIVLVLLSFLYEFSKLLKLAVLVFSGPLLLIGIHIYRINAYYLDSIKIGTFCSITKKWSMDELVTYLHMQEQNNPELKKLNKVFTIDELDQLTFGTTSILELNKIIVKMLTPLKKEEEVLTNTSSYMGTVFNYFTDNFTFLLAIGGLALGCYTMLYIYNVQNALSVTNKAAEELCSVSTRTLDEIDTLKDNIIKLTDCATKTDMAVIKLIETIPDDIKETLGEHSEVAELFFKLSDALQTNPLIHPGCVEDLLNRCGLDAKDYLPEMNDVKEIAKIPFPGEGRTLK